MLASGKLSKRTAPALGHLTTSPVGLPSLWGVSGVDIHCAFSQKVESILLGIVCGIEGYLISNGTPRSSKSQKNLSSKFLSMKHQEKKIMLPVLLFNDSRGIRIHVAPTEGTIGKDVF